MKYKLIVSDYDGTLLADDYIVSRENIEAIKSFESQGGMFMICTGRMTASIINECKKAGIGGLCIGYSGAMVYDLDNSRVLWQDDIKNKDAIEVVKDLEKSDLHTQIYLNDKLYTDIIEQRTRFYSQICGQTATETGIKLSEYLEKSKGTPHKILAFAPKEVVQEKIKEYTQKYKNVYFNFSNRFFIEAYSPNVDKWKAIEYVAKLKGITRDEIVCIGDANNDYPMIKNAGLGVAVANATDEIKSIAKLVVKSNNQSAIADLIRIVNESE